MQRNFSDTPKRFRGEVDVEALTGLSRRTLQKDRLKANPRFPDYKIGARCLYDLDEIEKIIRASRVGADAQ